MSSGDLTHPWPLPLPAYACDLSLEREGYASLTKWEAHPDRLAGETVVMKDFIAQAFWEGNIVGVYDKIVSGEG
jgi:hypothetical protein